MTAIEKLKSARRTFFLCQFFVVVLTGCQKISSIPTSEDNFIIVPPTDLTIFEATDASIVFYWQQVSTVGFSYYNVYFGTNSKALHLTAEITDNSFSIDSLSYDSTYYFQVTAVYLNDSESTPSNLDSAKSVNEYPPATPIGLTVQGHNDDSGKYMTLIWPANTDGDLGGYEIYRDTSATFLPDTTGFLNLIATSKTNAFRDTTDLTIGRDFFYRVIAFDFAHWRSQPSPPANDLILARPNLIYPSENSTLSAQNDLLFTFARVGGASGYIFYISTSRNGGDIYSTTLSPDQDSVSLSGASLSPNELYFWHVAATTLDPNLPNSVSGSFSFVLTQ